MRNLFILLLYFISINIFSQKIQNYDYIIDMKYYKAYYSNDILASSFVIYKLYKGGGDESRSNMNFKSYNKLKHFSYSKSGYDKGHLANAEDFAYSYEALLSTFYYINCVPQTVKLNRGIWKKFETEVRELSQNDSLLIICGGCDYNLKDSTNRKYIPFNCFKIVYNLRTKKCIYTLLFRNDDICEYYTENKLKRKISFKKALKLYSELPTK